MPHLTEAIDQGIGLLTFHRPREKNEATAEMWDQLGDALDRFARMDDVRVVVLTGSGVQAFVTEARDSADAALDRLAAFDKPLVARLRGDCVGAGLEVALHCDIRVAAFDSDFALPARRVYSASTLRRLALAVGPSQAKLLLMTGQRITAAEALRIRLVDRMVDDADLSDEVVEIARTIADHGLREMQAIKRDVDSSARTPA